LLSAFAKRSNTSRCSTARVDASSQASRLTSLGVSFVVINNSITVHDVIVQLPAMISYISVVTKNSNEYLT
jgi:hypothetical protein